MASASIRVAVVRTVRPGQLTAFTWKQIARNGSVTAVSDQDYQQKSKAVRSARRQASELKDAVVVDET
ncbi:hypothetical protein SEA_LILBEANIE_80 [Gordonia phage Lilbeanie]|uniref:Uncharacterized protein n=1 Tax=Gordonia phage Lilbeanie TaxID=2794947 RepID=A0A7T1KSC2_9CAUD|nr:hypothetical protein J1773_gp80 [Gordonia phage Lilbeanie]QPO17158.1 hypothetical protein SEA_LILBEANIE_80 [Gordonia phage Lilbeanie]